MRFFAFCVFAASFTSPTQAWSGSANAPTTLAESCDKIGISDACAIVAQASAMLAPSYASKKSGDAVAAFERLGYVATHVAAKGGFPSTTTHVFLVSKAGSSRLFIVFTGTDSVRDWAENAKVTAYTLKYSDGRFYLPPAHAGFRRGALNIIGANVFKENEFDDLPLDCASLDRRASILTRHVCRSGMPTGVAAIETVLVGHSRGAGIAIVAATAVAGLEVKQRVRGGVVEVAPQQYWPLRLHAIVAFAPPYAIYSQTDAAAGLALPTGAPDHWNVLRQNLIEQNTMMFINERDVVPGLSLGLGRHFGHRFLIRPNHSVVYDGMDWGDTVAMATAHSSSGYCADVSKALTVAPHCQ